MQKYIYISNRK